MKPKQLKERKMRETEGWEEEGGESSETMNSGRNTMGEQDDERRRNKRRNNWWRHTVVIGWPYAMFMFPGVMSGVEGILTRLHMNHLGYHTNPSTINDPSIAFQGEHKIQVILSSRADDLCPQQGLLTHLDFTALSQVTPKALVIASPQQGDLRLSGSPSGQGAGGGNRTRDKRFPADLGADSLATMPPTLQDDPRENNEAVETKQTNL
ncbi:hypothetical protein PoB_005624300 [Plakobranchus ocellatus]|uniref:Uncharacterized protein n=1 Tax=Plakobranchus ocellatus TaxID=259542 RepID=A0AAV4CCX6_9GAST|nr:hypothetical protein PoB_005624300 [Plakobranchus ocellatus]